MPRVVWSPYGFHLIDVPPKGSKFNDGHDISNILSPLPEILAPSQDGPKRKIVIYADNARPHCADTVTQCLDYKSLSRASHPLYFPDLAPPDFSLIEYLKGVLREISFDEPDELLSAIEEI
jgi:hypothetical protein